MSGKIATIKYGRVGLDDRLKLVYWLPGLSIDADIIDTVIEDLRVFKKILELQGIPIKGESSQL